MNPSEEQNEINVGENVDPKTLSKGQLKKLKEKQKKEAAAKEGGATEESTPATEATAEADGDDKDEGEGEVGADGKKGLSKGQLKKLKEKQKKEAEAAAAAAKKDDKPKEEEKDDKKDKKGAKKPMNAAAKLAQQRLEEMKRLEELRKQQEEELRRQEEEEDRKREEEERAQREIDEAKKKEKEEKIQKLKDEGKYRTKKEREREEALLRRREELIAQGVIPADTFAETGEKPKSKAVRTKKPKKKEETQQETQEEETAQETQAETTAETKPAVESWEAEADVDDWEKFAEPVVAKPQEKKETPAPKKVEEKPKAKVEEAKPKVEEPKPKVVESKPQEAVKEEAKEEKVSRREAKEKEKESMAAKFENKGPNDKIRSPIICILGHVDTGKTKLLDNMRRTNVQEGEAGGITQQIGATFFPYEKLEMEVAKTKSFYPVELEVPGLLIIDTPGHESFSNLRSRGSGLCDIAILVVDIMHGLEKQTLESIELLRFRKTPFVIALNKIDRLYGWKSKPDSSSYLSLKKQEKSTQLEFRDRSKAIITELTEKGFNVALYYDNPDPNTYVSMIPTSAMTGEGISDILSVAMNLTQKWLKKKITKKEEFKCTVLEVKVIEGLGASIDVMLVDGTLTEGDKIILAGYEGPIVTTVRALLTPHPMKEMRVKNEYIHHKAIGGAMGIKISANDLDKALAGSELYIIRKEEDEEMYREMLEEEIRKVKKSIKLVEEGVLVAASTLGSLEALLQFLKTSHIPVAAISIGPVSKAEIIKAMKPLQVVEGEVKKEFATILAFDVKVLQDAKDLAEQEGVKIFTANIIYHLFDHFTAYIAQIKEEKKQNEGKLAVFPCILKPVAFFNMKDPIVMGIDVVEGQLRINTPICVVEKGKIRIGAIESMEKEHKPILVARPSDGSIAVKLKGDSTIMAGRHFELKDRLVSILSRESIDALKKYFRDEMSKNDWELVKKLKPLFNII